MVEYHHAFFEVMSLREEGRGALHLVGVEGFEPVALQEVKAIVCEMALVTWSGFWEGIGLRVALGRDHRGEVEETKDAGHEQRVVETYLFHYTRDLLQPCRGHEPPVD